LPPASVLKFVEGKIYLENYWNPAQITVNNSISYDDAIEGAGELFSQAIQRRLDICKGRNVMVFLSGGQDSRHIAAELHQYLPIVTYTTTGFGPYIANKILAKKATNVLGIKNEYFTPPNHGFLTYWWPRAHYFMDYEADLHQWILPVVESLPDEPWINFDGILGDVCQASVFLTQEYMRLSQDGDLWGLAEKATGPEPILSIFRPEIRNKLSREGVIEKTRREFQRYSEHPYQVNLTFLRNRTRRAVSLFASKLVILKSETVYPFADNDFYEFTMSIPPQYKMDRKFHRHVLDRYFPQMKEILTTKEISLHDYYKDEFGCRRQKKQYILWNLKNRLQQIPWLFHKKSLFTKASLDLAFAYSGLDRAYFFCNPAFAVFFDWVEQYFPEGAD
jgi:asparagine synthetase B (glutamine-hydrolysing)